MGDTRLKQQIEANLIQEELSKEANYRNQMRMIQAQKEAGEAQKKEGIANEKWAKWEESADRLIESGQQGYDNWVASVSQINISALKLAKALSASDPLGGAIDYVLDSVIIPIGYAIKDLATAKFGSNPKVEIPSFKHLVGYNDDNTIDVDSIGQYLMRNDGAPVSESELNLVQTGIIAWMKSLGYTRKPEQPGAFFDAQDHQLTKDEFEAVRDDPSRGLSSFLSGHFDMDFQQTSSYRP